MAYTTKSKRLAYDNIATGSATGQERHNAAAGIGDQTSKESFDSITTSDLGSSYAANVAQELKVGWTGVGNVSDSNVHGPVGAVDTDLTPTSATTPGHTSGTSWTSAIHELLG